MNNWRLVHNITVFVPSPQKDGENLIFLSNSEDTKYKTAVIKELDLYTGYNHFDIEDGKFGIRVKVVEESQARPSLPFQIQIRSNLLPSKDIWYTVGNFYFPKLGELLSENTIIDGKFLGEEFEMIFSDEFPSSVAFISQKMSGYKSCIEELRRRLNCEFGKKTKKFIPGHRYDTQDETIYYIGEYLSRREKPDNSSFLDPSSAVPVYLYVKNIRCKSLEELLKTETFGNGEYDIQISYKQKMMIDSGEELKNDISGKGIQDFWKTMWTNTVNKCTVVDGNGYTKYENLKYLFDILSLLSTGDTAVYVDMRTELNDILHKISRKYIIENWNLKKIREDMEIGSSKTAGENAAVMSTFMFAGPVGVVPEDTNVMSCSYYSQLMKSFGVGDTELFKEELLLFNEDELCLDFEHFIKYQSYFLKRKLQKDVVSQQRQKSTKYNLALNYLKDLYGTGELTKTIKNIVNNANSNFGIGVDKYDVYNVGTTAKPCEFIDCIVSLNNIIKYCGGKDNMSPELKEEIVNTKFCMINIKYDKGEEVQ